MCQHRFNAQCGRWRNQGAHHGTRCEAAPVAGTATLGLSAEYQHLTNPRRYTPAPPWCAAQPRCTPARIVSSQIGPQRPRKERHQLPLS